MDDNSQEVPDNSENSEQLAIIDENVAPKRRGRPAGSKDKASRRTKTVIVETREPSPPREVVAPAQAPPSPRTLFQQASQRMTLLREKARRAYWQDAISKSLR